MKGNYEENINCFILPKIWFKHQKASRSFINLAQEKTEIEILDIAKNPVPMFLEKEINAYVKRNFGGQELTAEETELLKPFDEIFNQVEKSDF